MTETLYLLTICLPLATVLLVFGMKYFAAIQQAKAAGTRDEAYRQAVAQAATAQSETAAALSGIGATLAGVQARLAEIEKILRQVE